MIQLLAHAALERGRFKDTAVQGGEPEKINTLWYNSM
jgi:hypothetical protein